MPDAESKQRRGVPGHMREATRLTRAGRLREATALIQRTLRSRPDRPAPTDDHDVAPLGAAPQHEGTTRVDSTVVRTERATTRPAGTRRAPSDAVADPAGRFVTDAVTTAAGTRSYKLYVPGGRIGTDLPLIVMLHGCTQDAADFAVGTRMNGLADRHGLIVVYPEQSRQANQSGCWNWFKPGDQQRGRGEPSIIADIARTVAAAYPVDARQIYVAGMSAGGAMAAVMGATHPDLFAAVGIHSGIAYGIADDVASAFRVMRNGEATVADQGRGVPTIVFHGDRDQTVHVRNAELSLRQATAGAAAPLLSVHEGTGATGYGHTRSVYRDAEGGVLAEGWSVRGLGHAWSGGDPNGSYTDANGPDASSEMVRFFVEHRRTA